MTDDFTLAVIGVALFAAGVCLGVYFGMWGSETLEAEAWRRGKQTGFNEARATFSRAPVDVPTLRRPA